jgi:hypothetical protein
MPNIEYIASANLVFDSENPRMVEFGVNQYSEEQLINLLWKEMAVEELVMSILAQGFFEHEPLYVMCREDGKLIVLEGNRRLAAIRSILNPAIVKGERMKKFEGRITPETRNKLEHRIPVIILDSRQDAWRLLGFKHVNGPAKWGSYAKAKYIADIHRKFNISLDQIAEQIGDTNKTVSKLYQGFMVIEQAEKNAEFSIDDIKTPRLYYSHLYTALGYEKFRTYLGIVDGLDIENPVPEENYRNLQEVMDWLYGSKKRDMEPLIRTQNPDLRRFVDVLGNGLSVATLRTGSSLEVAFDLTIDDNDALRDALAKARLALDKATSKVGSFDGDEGLVRQAGTVVKLAQSLYDYLFKVYDERKNGKRDILTE